MTSAFREHPDQFLFELFGARCDTEADLWPFIEFLERQDLGPEQLVPKSGRKARFSRAGLAKVFEESAQRLSFALVRETAPALLISFTLPRNGEGRSIAISSYLPAGMFDEAASARFVTELPRAFAGNGVISGCCHSFADEVRARVSKSKDIGWEPETIDNVYWLNWYGRAFVDRIGRDRVLTTPAATLVGLPDGSVLWTTSPSPIDFASDESRTAQAKARCHLVDGVSFDAELERLRARSRSLVPVQPTWHPDLDPVMANIANNIRPPSQSDLVAELNAVPVLLVDEYRPAAGLTTDVEDPADAIETYEMYAEQLVALVHDKVETVGRFDPEDLPALDAHFWNYRYPEQFPQRVDELVSAVGGYLGELLVRRFGGRWVPREALDEAAVVIGDRAWLPFARARKYLANRAGSVQASMTRFVREVERARS